MKTRPYHTVSVESPNRVTALDVALAVIAPPLGVINIADKVTSPSETKVVRGDQFGNQAEGYGSNQREATEAADENLTIKRDFFPSLSK